MAASSCTVASRTNFGEQQKPYWRTFRRAAALAGAMPLEWGTRVSAGEPVWIGIDTGKEA